MRKKNTSAKLKELVNECELPITPLLTKSIN